RLAGLDQVNSGVEEHLTGPFHGMGAGEVSVPRRVGAEHVIVRRARGLGNLAHPWRIVLAGHRGERGPVPTVGKPGQRLHPVWSEPVVPDVGDRLAVPGIVAVRRSEW